MTRAFGIDPGSSMVGIAVIDVETMRLDDLEAIRGLETPEATFSERVWPRILRHRPTDRDVLLAEEAPPQVRSDVDHGPQAQIGYVQGFVSGLVVGAWLATTGPRASRASSSVWRPSLLVQAARSGLLLEKPIRRIGSASAGRVSGVGPARPPARGFVVYYAGCDHTVACADFAALLAKPTRCPTCEAPAVSKGMTPAEQVRDDWKRTACEAIAHLWPKEYSALVADARSRAKVNHPDHRLAGVPDACEAAGVALHAALKLLAP